MPISGMLSRETATATPVPTLQVVCQLRDLVLFQCIDARLQTFVSTTYSLASIKVKNVEVGPSSFVKLRMLGKGDVGKVYMVKEKGTEKLYAMKGEFLSQVLVA